ncbi:uncharacterized protein B0H64DRAFT_460810 [Chaetomium fimeti]|uniref:Uncharacterized protein n=1 Tax=Chaetomium fimeti TaxID=1854472 RepID=A0AAE0LSK6_9PEZI|nr:hypothetical protein B0H64DRAFT_460810 [Chaetomium fimeti]
MMEELSGLELIARYVQGDDDSDSLFGGDDQDGELGSLFTEPAAADVEPSSHGPDCELALPLPQERHHEATNPPAQLDSADNQPQIQLAEHSRRSLPLPSLPVLSQLSLPAVPDPLDASLSHQYGHTSGDLVVSTQIPAIHASGSGPAPSSPEELLDDAALEAELTGLWEADESNEQPVNTHAESHERGPIREEVEILTTQIPGFRYANSNTNSFIRLPRRIDFDPKLAQELVYYITLNRQTRVEVLYGYLELNVTDGRRLTGEMKKLMREPPLATLVAQPASRATDTKKILVKIAFYMLICKEWGRTWFGEDHETAPSRKYLWPRDSSILLAGFVTVLYRVYTNQKQTHQNIMRAQARLHEANPSPPLTPDPSAQPAGSPQIPAPAQEGQSFFEALARDASAGKKRKRDEAILGLDQVPYDVEIPANARLKYHIYVKDGKDGTDLAQPTTYRHTDYMISRGAFSSLKAAFEAAGQDPVYVIHTPFGRREVTTEAAWDNAVLAVYNARRSGGVVEVEVLV